MSVVYDTLSGLSKCLHSEVTQELKNLFGSQPDDGPRYKSFICFDDALVGPLSIYIHVTFLKELQLDHWWRLSKYHDLAVACSEVDNTKPIRIVVLANSSLTATNYICGLIDAIQDSLKTHGVKERARIELNFFPRRRTLYMSRILDQLKRLDVLPNPPNHLTFKYLSLTVADIKFPCFGLDEMVYSLERPTADRDLKLDGDFAPIQDLARAAVKLLQYAHIPEQATICGLGPTARLIAREIKDAFAAETATVTGNQQEVVTYTVEQQFKEAESVVEALLHGEPVSATKLPLPPDHFCSQLTPGMHKVLMGAKDQDKAVQMLQDEVNFCQCDSEGPGDELYEKVEGPMASFLFPSGLELPKREGPPVFTLERVVVIDRNCDWISPFAAPFTYEALLEQTWGIDSAHVDIPGEVLNGEPLKMKLTDQDKVYRETRVLPHTELGSTLHTYALNIQSAFERGRTGQWSMAEMQQVMSQLKQHQGEHRHLADHINVSTYLVANVIKQPAFYTLLRIEDEIMGGASSFEENCRVLMGLCDRQYPLEDIYRLAALNCRVHGEQFDRGAHQSLRRQLCREHGIWESYRWSALEKAGILGCTQYKKGTLSDWQFLKKTFDIVRAEEPILRDISYVHSGYAPLLVKLFQSATMENEGRTWKTVTRATEESMVAPVSRLLGGGGGGRGGRTANTSMPPEQEDKLAPVTILIVPGGITRSELSACRYLAEHQWKGVRAIMVLTTGSLGYRQLVAQYGMSENGIGGVMEGYDQALARAYA